MRHNQTCNCDAYHFPHRHLSGKCGEQAELDAIENDAILDDYERRGIRDIALYESGMNNSDFA